MFFFATRELLKVFQHQLSRMYNITPKMKSFVRDFVPRIIARLGDLQAMVRS